MNLGSWKFSKRLIGEIDPQAIFCGPLGWLSKQALIWLLVKFPILPFIPILTTQNFRDLLVLLLRHG
jgi:hypothetical protein